MMQNVKKLEGSRIQTRDAELGSVEDVYFDDERWVVRYLVVDTGKWLRGRKVLISPYAVQSVNLPARLVAVDLTREQVESSPDIDTDKPVSRRQEAEYFRYYGYPGYWPYTTYWAWGAVPVLTPPAAYRGHEDYKTTRAADAEPDSTTHLRSINEVRGYHVQATDDAVGHVEDFIVDEQTWAIGYLVLDTRNWLPGKHVLISVQSVREVSWAAKTVYVALSRAQIEQAPEFDPDRLPGPAAEFAGADRGEVRST